MIMICPETILIVTVVMLPFSYYDRDMKTFPNKYKNERRIYTEYLTLGIIALKSQTSNIFSVQKKSDLNTNTTNSKDYIKVKTILWLQGQKNNKRHSTSPVPILN